jgi:hypothetical protein
MTNYSAELRLTESRRSGCRLQPSAKLASQAFACSLALDEMTLVYSSYLGFHAQVEFGEFSIVIGLNIMLEL